MAENDIGCASGQAIESMVLAVGMMNALPPTEAAKIADFMIGRWTIIRDRYTAPVKNED